MPCRSSSIHRFQTKMHAENESGTSTLKRILHVAIVAAGMTAIAAPAHAGGGDFAAGIFGGLAAGAIIGSTRPYYYGPPPPPPPAYYYDGPRDYGPCHWERGRRYWDDYEGVWRWSRVRVCD
jgi:hypothetical protein